MPEPKELLRQEMALLVREALRDLVQRGELVWKLLKRYHRGIARTQPRSLREYQRRWESFADPGLLHQRYTIIDRGVPRQVSWLTWRTDYLVPEIRRYLERARPRTVLEVGCGMGANLLCLAPLYPRVRFVGLEPTASGVERARAHMAAPPREFAAAHAAAPLENVEIVQGSILDPAVLEGERFDFVFTTGVLEQLHYYAHQAFANIFRLCRGHFFFYEEFREANLQPLSLYRYLVDVDYFRHSWDIFERYPQVEILERRLDQAHKPNVRYGLVFGRMR
jgi:SAM-dependent methyltransferase